MNSRKKHIELEVRLLAKKLSKEDIRKYSKFETLATTLCDQQEALDEALRRYDEQVQSSSAQVLAREPSPSMTTVDSDAARVTEFNRGIQSGRVQEAHQESTGSSSAHPLRREELIPDSIRKTTLANFETKTLKAFCNIFAHHKNAHAKISD